MGDDGSIDAGRVGIDSEGSDGVPSSYIDAAKAAGVLLGISALSHVVGKLLPKPHPDGQRHQNNRETIKQGANRIFPSLVGYASIIDRPNKFHSLHVQDPKILKQAAVVAGFPDVSIGNLSIFEAWVKFGWPTHVWRKGAEYSGKLRKALPAMRQREVRDVRQSEASREERALRVLEANLATSSTWIHAARRRQQDIDKLLGMVDTVLLGVVLAVAFGFMGQIVPVNSLGISWWISVAVTSMVTWLISDQFLAPFVKRKIRRLQWRSVWTMSDLTLTWTYLTNERSALASLKGRDIGLNERMELGLIVREVLEGERELGSPRFGVKSFAIEWLKCNPIPAHAYRMLPRHHRSEAQSLPSS